MKKKQFEAILPEYEGLKADKAHKYSVGAFVHDHILAIDFYEENEDRWKAIWRTLINCKEFWNYKYRSGIWDERGIESIASECMYISPYRYNSKEKDYGFLGDAENIINEFVKEVRGYVYGDIFTSLSQLQYLIREEQRETAAVRKHRRIQEKMQLVPALPRDFKRFINEKLYKNDHLMFMDKEKVFCSRCGAEYDRDKNMKHNLQGRCRSCKKQVTYKSIGKMAEHDEQKEVLIIQRWENDVILRYFNCSLYSKHGKKEQLEYTESVRTYHNRRIEQYEKRYIQYADMFNKLFWSDKMNPWHQVVYGVKCCLYAGNLPEISDLLGEFNNLPIEEMAGEGVLLPWKDILRGYYRTNIFERLYKAGMGKLAVEFLRSRNVVIDGKKRELKQVLMITKPMLDYMREHNSGNKVLQVLQDAKGDNCGLNNAEIFELAEAGILVSELKKVAAGSRLIKTLHYLQRVKGYSNLKNTYSHYVDYIGMVQSMGYDMDNGTVRYPKDLRAAHDKAVSDFCEGETDKKKREAMRKYPMIAALAAGLNEQYGYHDKNYVIVVPKNAGDIVEEGRILHHCVGGDRYLDKHNQGRTYIVFLRKCSEPEKRYYTIEIDPKDNRIVQYYGYNDKKPDKEPVDKFLNKWKRHLKKQETEKKTALLATV